MKCIDYELLYRISNAVEEEVEKAVVFNLYMNTNQYFANNSFRRLNNDDKIEDVIYKKLAISKLRMKKMKSVADDVRKVPFPYMRYYIADSLIKYVREAVLYPVKDVEGLVQIPIYNKLLGVKVR